MMLSGQTPDIGRFWYQRWPGVVLAGLGLLFFATVVILSILTLYYWREIKSGRAVVRPRPAGSFTTILDSSEASSAGFSSTEIAGSNQPLAGSAKPRVTVVEFVDWLCPNCQAAAPILKQVLANYGDKVQLVIRDFPAETLHPGAGRLAEFAHCAEVQGRFWDVADLFYARQSVLSSPPSELELAEIARAAELEPAALSRCRADPATSAAVQRDYLDGIRYGVRGTPTFFINGEKVEGVVPYSVWQGYLNGI